MEKLNANANEWERSDAAVFWGEIAPCDHVVQIYEDNESFLSILEEFVATGLEAQEAVILIATDIHLQALAERLQRRNYDVDSLTKSHQYQPINARETLAKFMVNDWPDEQLFNTCINEIISRAKKNHKKVRAFGEMVALLWADGKNGATVNLERLWSQLHYKEAFTLYCAYPRTGFTQSPEESLKTICDAHQRVIDGKLTQGKLIYHQLRG